VLEKIEYSSCYWSWLYIVWFIVCLAAWTFNTVSIAISPCDTFSARR
jgi:hypothetical protein